MEIDSPGVRTKTLWIREPYLSQILAGRKTVEVRVGYDNIRRLRPGDRLRLNDEHLVTICRIGRYADFEELLAHEDPAAIAPDLVSPSTIGGQGPSPDELLAAIRQIYPLEKESLGAIALEVRVPSTAQDHRYQAILFDLGYTLIHFEPLQEVVAQAALREIGAERSVSEISAAVRAVWGEYFSEAATISFPATEEYDRQVQRELEGGLLRALGLEPDPELVEAYMAALESWFQRPGVIRPYPEVVDVLTRLRAESFRLGIVSNWSWNLRDRVAQVTLTDFFEIIWASAYAGCNKPHRGIFDQALARMQPPALSPDRVLYVGDSYPHDVVGARNAGLDVVLLDRAGTAGEVDCRVIRDLRGVFDLLAE